MEASGDNKKREYCENGIVQIDIKQLLLQIGISEEKWAKEILTVYSPFSMYDDEKSIK
ncbi:hypothetical protein Back11_31750 [Paenibacillus baekrokdamisoli]|uniref:Uncharacterized protein n=1 Tax=Paenibacillus baekrokdamisoli TaxID=1712516 RepID=A0A3G9ISL4_9BACL|nr:hypothetical protein Back11_31750 [Paenibacillus baekrokdamisoli]